MSTETSTGEREPRAYVTRNHNLIACMDRSELLAQLQELREHGMIRAYLIPPGGGWHISESKIVLRAGKLRIDGLTGKLRGTPPRGDWAPPTKRDRIVALVRKHKGETVAELAARSPEVTLGMLRSCERKNLVRCEGSGKLARWFPARKREQK